MGKAPNFSFINRFFRYVSTEVMIGCDFDLVLIECYKETLESQLIIERHTNKPLLNKLTLLK